MRFFNANNFFFRAKVKFFTLMWISPKQKCKRKEKAEYHCNILL